MYASVYTYNPLERPYTYMVPVALRAGIAVGSRVAVPLGSRRVTGLVVELSDEKPAGVPRLKPIHRVLERPAALSPELVALGWRIAAYYVCSPGEAFAAMVPSYAPPAPPPRFSLAVPSEDAFEAVGARARRQQELIEVLAAGGAEGVPRPVLGAKGLQAAARALEKKGLVEVRGEDVPGLPVEEEPVEGEMGRFPDLTAAQQEVVAAVRTDMEAGSAATHLVHGVTGSGKTEIYLALIREALDRGEGALFLVPEIALTVTMIERVRARFGPWLAVLHSRMGARERYLEWAKVRAGRARVVLGPRSSVFAPVERLGLVVIDEEHEGSYKQQDKPRYHAREVARWRAAEVGCPVVLGSATPSLEAYHAATSGAFAYHRLGERFRQSSMPEVRIVDMTEEFTKHRNRSIFSMELKRAMTSTLDGGGQALLFMNRRGFHTYVFCRGCGHTVECEACSVALTYHFQGSVCLCHHCGHRATPPTVCPQCESRAIRYAGTGTQRVAREFAMHFPGIEFQRMDSDTTRRRGAHERILDAFGRRETRVLIGTQMVAKGFDFPHLHLVGVVNADSGLTVPDFRGAEKAFQLLTQVAGRAGRGEEQGRVFLQTYRPDHYALRAAAKHDYEGFAARELPIREELFYPPFSRVLLAIAEGPDEEECIATLEALRTRLEDELTAEHDLRLLGPAPAPLMRLEGRHRQHLLVKMEDRDATLSAVKELCREHGREHALLKVDVDPMNLL